MRSKRKTLDRQLTASDIDEKFQAMKSIIFADKPLADDDFKKYLFSVQHALRYPAKDVRSGRRSKHDRDKIIQYDAPRLRKFLDDETGDEISLLYFISNCVPVLFYPKDLRDALDDGSINLSEARTLARINRKNLGNKNREPYHVRRDLIESHLRRNGSQSELVKRVNNTLGITSKAEAASVTRVISTLDAEVSALIEFDEFDTNHLLWEEIKSLVFLARDVDVNLVDDDEMKRLLQELGKIKNELIKYKPQIEDLKAIIDD